MTAPQLTDDDKAASQLDALAADARLRIEALAQDVAHADLAAASGRVTRVAGLLIEARGPAASIGDLCLIHGGRSAEPVLAEVVGFHERTTFLMPFGDLEGVRPGSRVAAQGQSLAIPAGNALEGRVVNAIGQPLDDAGPIRAREWARLNAPPPHPLKRQRIEERFRTGVKALDAFAPCGVGQRLGIFAGSGVGKSTLLGMIAEHSESDVNVIALIGERGREVREFLENCLDEVTRRKTVLIVATSDEPPIMRLKGAFASMAIAEHFRDQGRKALLMIDSVTRIAMAQREISLSIGELPATKGYPPSVFALLPRLLERAGAGETGSITGLFTVLVEGDDMNDPVADTVRSILDGHIVLNRELAAQGHYPSIDVLQSVSRLDRELTKEPMRAWTQSARAALALCHENRDLISVGAYAPGSNPQLDQALAAQEPLKDFLRQQQGEGFLYEECQRLLESALSPISAHNN